MTASCLYAGTVMHRRFKPREHRLRYRVFWALLDLDEIPRARQEHCASSRASASTCSASTMPIMATARRRRCATQVERHLEAAGLTLDGGRIRLLCMPRILGFVFNPISVYYCYHRDGALTALLYEVHNTFGAAAHAI